MERGELIRKYAPIPLLLAASLACGGTSARTTNTVDLATRMAEGEGRRISAPMSSVDSNNVELAVPSQPEIPTSSTDRLQFIAAVSFTRH